MNLRYIKGYEGKYLVSRMGGVYRKYKYSIKELHPFRKHTKNGSDYYCVNLTDSSGKRKTYKLSKIVWNAYHKPIKDDECIIHVNGDISDNCLHNLRNVSKKQLGVNHGWKAKNKPVAKIDRNLDVVEVYRSSREAGRKNCASYQAILDRCNGKVKKRFTLIDGYDFVYEDAIEYLEDGSVKIKGMKKYERN